MSRRSELVRSAAAPVVDIRSVMLMLDWKMRKVRKRLACGSQPANKKLLNRRESAGVLTFAPTLTKSMRQP